MAISEQVLHPGGVAVVDAPAPTTVAPVPAPVADAPPVSPPLAPLPAPAVVLPPVVAAPTPPVIDTATPAVTTTGAVVDACTSAASTTWDWTKATGRVVSGLRTLLFFGVSGAGLLIAKVQEVDVSGFISRLTGAAVSPEDIMIFLTVAGIVLRFVTNTPVFARWRKAAQGDSIDQTASAVDDPEA